MDGNQVEKHKANAHRRGVENIFRESIEINLTFKKWWEEPLGNTMMHFEMQVMGKKEWERYLKVNCKIYLVPGSSSQDQSKMMPRSCRSSHQRTLQWDFQCPCQRVSSNDQYFHPLLQYPASLVIYANELNALLPQSSNPVSSVFFQYQMISFTATPLRRLTLK
jgi:hypothetical protein